MLRVGTGFRHSTICFFGAFLIPILVFTILLDKQSYENVAFALLAKGWSPPDRFSVSRQCKEGLTTPSPAPSLHLSGLELQALRAF